MADPPFVKTVRGKGRMYQSPVTGEMLPSVPSVLDKGVPRPAIPGWAAKRTAIAAVDALTEGGLVGKVLADKEAAIRELAAAPWAELDRTGNRSTHVSDLIRGRLADPTSIPVGLDPDDAATAESGLRFLREFGATGIRTNLSVFNDTSGYAGNLDFLAEMPNGNTMIGQWKTGRGVYKQAAIGCAGLSNAEYIAHPDGTVEKMPEVDGALAVKISPTGYAAMPLDIGPDAYAAFQAAKETWKFEVGGGRTAVGAPVSASEFFPTDPPDDDQPFGEPATAEQDGAAL